MNLVDELHAISATLRAAGIVHAVCGGVAVTIHGATRLLDDRLDVALPEGTLTVVSRDALVRMKRLAGRPQDVADLEKLDRPDET